MTGRACFTVLVSFVLLSRLLRDGGAITCTETKPQLRELGDRVSQLSECILECSGMTYFKKLQLQDKRTIKFQVPTEGKAPSCHLRSHFLNITLWLNVLKANHNHVTITPCCTPWLNALSFQETLGNIAGLRSWTAASGRASSTPTRCYLQIHLQWGIRCWKWRPRPPLSPGSRCTTAPPPSQRAAATFTRSRGSSARRTQGRQFACRWPPTTTSRNTQS